MPKYESTAYAVPSVSGSDRGRLEASRVFVKEDCESLAAPALAQRLAAVSAGKDKVAKVLHTRYGRARLEALKAESGRLHRKGRSAGPEGARTERALGEAASESRRIARSGHDGTDAAARERQKTATQAAF